MSAFLRGAKNILLGPWGMLLAGVLVAAAGIAVFARLAGTSSIPVMSSLRANGVIKIGVSSDLSPFGSYDGEGNLTGFEADLARYIGNYVLPEGGVQLVAVSPKTSAAMLNASEVDVLIARVSQSEYEETFNLTDAYYTDAVCFLSSGGGDIKSGDTVGAIYGSEAKALLNAYIKEKGLEVTVVDVPSYPDAVAEIQSGEITAFCAEKSVLSSIQASGMSIAGPEVGAISYCVSVRTRERDLFSECKKALAQARSDGTLDSLYSTYGLSSPQSK